MPGADAARLARLAEETHYKVSGLASEYACASALHFLKGKPGASLWGSTALNLCWIPQPRMLRRLEVVNAGGGIEKGEFILEREDSEAIRVEVAHRSIDPLFGLVEREVVTPFDDFSIVFPTCAAEEVVSQIVLDIIREGGILLAYDLSSVRQVAFDVEAVRRCLMIYLLAHGLPPRPEALKARLSSLTDADIERDLDPLLADRVPMIAEVQFRAWNLAAIFFEHRETERAFLEGAKKGAGDPALLFPGRQDLVDHPLTTRALDQATKVL